MGALPRFCILLELAQVPVGFSGDRVGQGYLVCGGGILATMYNGGNVRTSFGVLVIYVIELCANDIANGAGGTDRRRRRRRRVGGGEAREAADGRRRDRAGARAGKADGRDECDHRLAVLRRLGLVEARTFGERDCVVRDHVACLCIKN